MKRRRVCALLLALALAVGTVGLAAAEEIIYVTPRFRIPEDRIIVSNEISLTPAPEETDQPEDGNESPAPEESTGPEGAETPAPEGTEQPEDGNESPVPEESTAPEEAETPAPEGTEQPEDGNESPAPEESNGPEGAETPAPEGTEQPEDGNESPAPEESTGPDATESPEPEISPDPTSTPVPEKKVTIYSSRGERVAVGERIDLTSRLEGFEGLNVTFQWQADRGNGWENIQDATRDSYSFIATEDTMTYVWRLLVYFEAP